MYFRKNGYKYAVILFFLITITSLTEKDVFARRYVLMNVPELNYKFSYEFEKEKRSAPAFDREDTTETFVESLDINTGGWVYHPALLEYKLRLSPEWEQMSQEPGDEEEIKTSHFLQGYFTEFTFLQFKPYTLRMFANRRRLTISSNFARRSKRDLDAYGATLMLKYNVMPTVFDYKHSRNDQTGFFDFEENTDEMRVEMRPNRVGRSILRASYKDTETETRGQISDSLEQKISFHNSYETADKRTFRTDMGYRSSQGEYYDFERNYFSENLLWRHRKNLRTNYNFRYESNDFQTTESETKSLGFNLTHILYENLTTSVNASGVKNQYSGTEELKYGGGLDFNYMRKIPVGILNMNMGHDYFKTERDKKESVIEIMDESVILKTGDITLLANKHINIDSIRVKNSQAPFDTYVRDSDYRITEIGSSVRISIIIGGNIPIVPNGYEVLVDYEYLSDPAFDFSVFGRSYGINLNLWSVWNIYYNLNMRTERFLSGIPPDELIDDRISSAGTSLNWKWSRTDIAYSDIDTTNVPKREWKMSETVTFRPSRAVFLSGSGRYVETEFTDIEKTEFFYGYNVNMQMLTSRKSRLTLKGFRNKVYGPSEDNINSGFSAVFELAYRILRGSIEFTHSKEQDTIARETIKNSYVMFEIKTVRF